MADNNGGGGGWVLRSSSSGALKRSSSVEILLGTHPTRSRLLASPTSPTGGHVTSHKMKGSGHPLNNNKADTLPHPSTPSSDVLPPAVHNGGISQFTPGGTDILNAIPDFENLLNDAIDANPEFMGLPAAPGNCVLHISETPSPVPFAQLPEPLTPILVPLTTSPAPASPPPVPLNTNPASDTTTPHPLPVASTPVPLTTNPGSVIPTSPTSIVPPPVPFTTNPASVTPAPPPVTSTPVTKDNAVPDPPTSAPQSPQVPRVKYRRERKGGVLPPLIMPNKTEHPSPMGTPVIGKRGHVFSVSTPEVLPESGHPLPIDTSHKPTTENGGDPFELRRKTRKPVKGEFPEENEAEGKEEDNEGEEPVWQRRLSLLFVPPTEDELEPEKEIEETCQLLPKSTPPLVAKRLPSDPPLSPQHRRRRERKEREEKEAERRSSRKESKTKKEGEEEPRDRRKQSRIIFQDETKRKEEKEEERHERSRFSRYKYYVDSDGSSSSSLDSSEGEEEEEEGVGGDDYTSWDDTICSNRSSYFKKYYIQRGIIGGSGRADDKENNLKSILDASHSSLSSLIRERMGKPQAPAPGKKTRADIGLMVLVVVLFVVIVAGISLTNYFYNLHLLELSIFNCINFFETPRRLEVYDPEGRAVITAHLGSHLPDNSIPEDCTHYLHYLHERNFSHPHHALNDGTYTEMICLDWTALAQLQLRKLRTEGEVQCYSVWWAALSDEFTLEDCLDADPELGTWWGGGEMTNGGYPVTRANVPLKEMVTGKLGRDSWGQLLSRTWLSNRATMLTLPDDFRGRVSVNHESDKQVCLEMPAKPGAPRAQILSYSLCTAPNITSLIDYLHQKAVNERKVVGEAASSLVKHSVVHERMEATAESPNISSNSVLREEFTPEVVLRVKERLKNPVWIPWMPPDNPLLTQEAVMHYVDMIHNNETGYGIAGHVLLPPTWQTRPGELEFDPKRFPDPVNLSKSLSDKGFHLALTIHPFVSVEAPSFGAGTRDGLWVRQRNSVLPALATYDERHPSVVTDFTNPTAKRWFALQLQKLKDKYNIDRFHLQPADAHALPTFHEYHEPVPGPDATIIHFMASVSSVSPPISTEGTVTPPMPPTFLTLGTADGSWAGLETLVPRLLTLTMLGYPLVDIGPIGGLARAGHVPDRELYIRWLEAAAFLPSMQMSVLPSTYGEEVESLAREYLSIREELVLPRLLEKVPGALYSGTPLVTPLSLFVPDDPEAATVDDEWMLGDDLLVAPVTHRGDRTRTFYLPKGIWKDGIDGHLRSGGRWVKNYKVPLTKIPHFTLKYIDDFDT